MIIGYTERAGGVGEQTENLFDNRTRGFYSNDTGNYIDDPDYSYWRIPVTEGDIIYVNDPNEMGWGCCFYQGNYVQGSRLRPYNFPYTVPAGVDEVTNNYPAGSSAMVTVNRATPATYVPYGYKLPMTVQSVNLFDKNATDVDKGYAHNRVFDANGNLGNSSLYDVSEYMQVEPLKEYFLENFHNPAWTRAYGCACFYDSDKNVLSSIKASDADSLVLLAPESARFIRISVYFPTCKFYSSAPQKENVYIGENQLDSVEGVADYVDKASGKIVRKIAEYTFTGEETFYSYNVGFYTEKRFLDGNSGPGITTRFSHFTTRSNAPLGAMCSVTFGDNCGCFRIDEGNVMLRSSSNFTTVTECKAYMKSQYDNGTPVKISYWLKVPIDEEPPVPFPDIPTIKGETIIDYDGEPKPSQMYVKYKAKR